MVAPHSVWRIRDTECRATLASSPQRGAPRLHGAELDLTDALKVLPRQIGINNLLLYIATQTLIDMPQLNATYEDGRLYHYPNIHLSVAVALPDGLMSPVLRRADDYSLTGLTRQELVYNKEKLLELGGVHDDRIRKWKRKAEEAVEQGVTP